MSAASSTLERDPELIDAKRPTSAVGIHVLLFIASLDPAADD
jgi:hypothetical protein